MTKNSTSDYRRLVDQLGKKQFTFLKMQEYGFWPKDLPTPYEQQEDESDEDYAKRQKLMKNHDKLISQIAKLYTDKDKINKKLMELKKTYGETYDPVKIRKQIAKDIWQESIKRREERKRQSELERRERAEAWKKKKAEEIVFIGKGYSSMLYKFDTNTERLTKNGLPILENAHELCEILDIDFTKLRFLTYHRDVVEIDHYHRYKIPKRSGGTRSIAAPKSLLKHTQRAVLDKILSLIPTSIHAHGFIQGKSVITAAKSHPKQPYLIINMDLKDFFPTLTFERVRGMFHSFGYSGHISSLLSMLCTYCDRVPIEVKNNTKYVAISKRILPQGSPASPMITNVICRRLDKRLKGLSDHFGFNYSRYADDLSFSLLENSEINLGRFCGLIYKIINEEGFEINSSKTRFLRKNNQQKITGVILNNSELGLPRKWIRKYRAAIHNANQMKKVIPKEKKYEIAGMTSWVKSVNPERYQKLIEAANKIIN